MSKLVKVGKMPGRIEEFAVNVGDKVTDVIAQAGLDATGHDIKVDGTTITDGNAVVDADTNLILLVQQVKGNSVKTVKVGKMPGRIEEFATEVGSPIASLIEQAGLDASGHDIKVDGVTVSDPSSEFVSESTNLVLLVQQVKGN